MPRGRDNSGEQPAPTIQLIIQASSLIQFDEEKVNEHYAGDGDSSECCLSPRIDHGGVARPS